jgi:hypothetical protein
VQSAIPSIAGCRRTDANHLFHRPRGAYGASVPQPNLRQLEGRDQICLLDDSGRRLWRCQCSSDPEQIGQIMIFADAGGAICNHICISELRDLRLWLARALWHRDHAERNWP